MARSLQISLTQTIGAPPFDDQVFPRVRRLVYFPRKARKSGEGIFPSV
jgi:hypothetical protein